MNVETRMICRPRSRSRTGILRVSIMVLALTLSKGAGNVWAGVPNMLDDPLHARPPILDTGATLPGDDDPIPCPSNKDFALPLALGEAADLALCNNPQIQATWAVIKIQAGVVGEAEAAYLPTLSGTVSRLRTRTDYPNTPAASNTVMGHTTYGTFAWRLFDFGGRAANREAAGRMLEAALAGHDAALQRVLVATVQAYFDALTAKGGLTARTETAAIAQTTLEAARRREIRGAVPQSDTLQAETAFARESLARMRAEGDYRKALAVLIQALGIPSNTMINLPDLNDTGSIDDAKKDLESWLAETEARHPAIRAARLQVESAKQKVVATRSEGLPTLDFSANYYQNGYPGQGLQATRTQIGTVGVTLTVPIFEGFLRTYKIQEAEARVEQSEAQLADTKYQILTEMAKAHADAVSSLANLKSSGILLDAAQSALASSQRRYAKGATDILEVLNTQSAVAEAKQERVRCSAEWRSARLRLLAGSGMLGRSKIGQGSIDSLHRKDLSH